MIKNSFITLSLAFMLCGIILTYVHTIVFAEKTIERTYEASTEVFGNPLMGYVPQAEYNEVAEDISLVYVDITWKELESTEGQYNWEKIEEKNHFQKWREAGKHVVLRFVLDVPGKQKHMDIPEWLYQAIKHDGDWYSMEYGKGFALNYANQTLIEKHQRAVAAMGERWGNDPFISFIELGSIGHWGEWHVNFGHDGIRRLPKEDVLAQYVTPWVDAFPNTKILMRRPFNLTKQHNLGIYNDMVGEALNSENWLGWIQQGGVYDQTGERNLVAMPDAWKTQPIGGEMTSAHEMESLLSERLQATLKHVVDGHMTFIGPKTAKRIEGNNGYDEILRQLGYRIFVSKASLKPSGSNYQLELTWQNNGNAPFYYNWPINLYVSDTTGNRVATIPIEMNLTSIVPGTTQTSTTLIELSDLFNENVLNYNISIGVVDPMTEKDTMRFAMNEPFVNNENVLFTANTTY